MDTTIEDWKAALEELQKELDMLNNEINETRKKLTEMIGVVNHEQ